MQCLKCDPRVPALIPSLSLPAGGEIEVKHEKGILTVDKWAEFEASPRIAVLVRELRAGVDRLLLSKARGRGGQSSCAPLANVRYLCLHAATSCQRVAFSF